MEAEDLLLEAKAFEQALKEKDLLLEAKAFKEKEEKKYKYPTSQPICKMNIHTLKFVVTNENAIIPTKAYPTDAGFDLTIIKVHKVLSDRVTLYDTGIAVQPPHGYYTEIVPRSSLSKSGYMLANSIGIIDPTYTGNLLIALMRIDDSVEPFTLPFKCAQLILRKAESCHVELVSFIEKTERGDGGFGSTDTK